MDETRKPVDLVKAGRVVPERESPAVPPETVTSPPVPPVPSAAPVPVPVPVSEVSEVPVSGVPVSGLPVSDVPTADAPASTPSSSKGASSPERRPSAPEPAASAAGERHHHAAEGTTQARLVETLGMRPTRSRLLAALLCALLGFALVVQVRQRDVGLEGLRQSELVGLLDNVTTNSERLAADTRELQITRDKLSSSTTGTEAAEQAARDRLEVLGILAGTLPATGTGIQLTIADPDHKVTSAILIDTIQELRDAGAEAMQVDDVRIVAGTYLVDSQSGVRVGTEVVTAPYTFTVIGDSQTLGAALEIPGGVLEVLRTNGAGGTVAMRPSVTVDAIASVPRTRFARPAPASS